MPESPDFDQIARRVLDVVLEDVEGLDMMSAAQEGEGNSQRRLHDVRRWSERVTEQIAEQLRQVWNARGAADIAKLEELWREGTLMPDVGRAFRSLDR